jgi:methyl-accepting chemotaxis protein
MAKSTTNPPDLDTVLEQVLGHLGELPGIIGNLGAILDKFISSFNPLIAAISQLSLLAATDDTVVDTQKDKTTSQLVEALNRQLTATNRLVNEIDRLIAAMFRMAQEVHPTAEVAESTPAAAGGGVGALGRLAAIGAVAAAALGILVVATGVLEREFHKLEGLVRLFNPAVILIFQQALDNLGATIGRAFVPLFQDLTEVTRQYAAILKPIIANLLPLIQQLSDIFANLLLGVLRQVGNLLTSLASALKPMSDVVLVIVNTLIGLFNATTLITRGLILLSRLFFELSGLGIIVRVLNKVLEALNQTFQILDEAFNIFEVVVNSVVDSIVALISSVFPVQGIMDALTRAIQYVIRNMYVFAVMLAKLAGLDDVVAALIDSIDKRANAKGDTAAQTPQIKNLEQLSKDLALAAATAGGAAGQGGVKNQQEFWAKTLEAMKDAAKNGVSIKDIMLEIRDAVRRMVPGVGGGNAAAAPGVGGAGRGGLPDKPGPAPSIWDIGGMPGRVLGGIIGN